MHAEAPLRRLTQKGTAAALSVAVDAAAIMDTSPLKGRSG
jgi:hypothetical protein